MSPKAANVMRLVRLYAEHCLNAPGVGRPFSPRHQKLIDDAYAEVEAEVRTLAAAEQQEPIADLKLLEALAKYIPPVLQEHRFESPSGAGTLASHNLRLCLIEVNKAIEGKRDARLIVGVGFPLEGLAAPLQREQGEETAVLPPLPKEAVGYMRGCNLDLQHGALLFTAAQMHAYARAALAGVGPNEGSVNQAWLPISSAPKDGTQILLCDDDGIRVVGQWGKHNHIPMYGWIRPVELYGEEVDGFDAVCWIPINAAPIGAT